MTSFTRHARPNPNPRRKKTTRLSGFLTMDALTHQHLNEVASQTPGTGLFELGCSLPRLTR